MRLRPELDGGEHSLVVRYRTNGGVKVAAGGKDWQTRALNVVVRDRVTSTDLFLSDRDSPLSPLCQLLCQPGNQLHTLRLGGNGTWARGVVQPLAVQPVQTMDHSEHPGCSSA